MELPSFPVLNRSNATLTKEPDRDSGILRDAFFSVASNRANTHDSHHSPAFTAAATADSNPDIWSGFFIPEALTSRALSRGEVLQEVVSILKLEEGLNSEQFPSPSRWRGMSRERERASLILSSTAVSKSPPLRAFALFRGGFSTFRESQVLVLAAQQPIKSHAILAK
ncbi:hypothetical protein Pelo_2597 [Pelomyxa schiedti]|nr:hypothetical protein Pelo_2597 [Pelomyxa schiedti]